LSRLHHICILVWPINSNFSLIIQKDFSSYITCHDFHVVVIRRTFVKFKYWWKDLTIMCMCIHKLDIIYVAYVYFAHDFFFEKTFWHGWMWNEGINDEQLSNKRYWIFLLIWWFYSKHVKRFSKYLKRSHQKLKKPNVFHMIPSCSHQIPNINFKTKS
jgi:hypothetical protein